MTGNQLIERIQSLCGLPSPGMTVDRLIAGDGQQTVRGVSTSFIASVPALRRAAERGVNFFITHEPTFYNHLDTLDEFGFADDPVVQAKQKLIADTGMMIYRFHDLTHHMRPDLIHQGVLECLGWPAAERYEKIAVVEIAPTRLADLARLIRVRTGGQAVRYAGNPDHLCRRVALCVGSPAIAPQFVAMRLPQVDVMVIGETSEWSVSEYARDATSLGRGLGVVFAGHRNSEEAGMAWIARWLSEGVGIEVQHIPSGDPLCPA